MDQFVCRLRTRASTCEFVNVDEAIRDQIIDWCYSNQLRRKDKLDLKAALDTARAYETVNHRVKEMEIKPASVNAVNIDKKMPGMRGDQRRKSALHVDILDTLREIASALREKQNVSSAEKWGILNQDALSQRSKQPRTAARTWAWSQERQV